MKKLKLIYKQLLFCILFAGLFIACTDTSSISDFPDGESGEITDMDGMVAGDEESLEEMKIIEEKLKTVTPPTTDGYKALVEKINQSSQSGGNVTTMSTASLIESVLNSEFLLIVYTRNDLQSGFDWFAEQHNGLKELIKRNDAPLAIFKKYKSMPIIGYLSSASLEEKGSYSLKVLFLETMLAQESVLKNLPINSKFGSRSDIAKTVFDKMEIKNQHPKVYGYFSNTGGAFVVSRMMKLDNSLSVSKSNEDLSMFIEKGHIPSPETMTLIFSSGAQKYLK